MNNRFCTRCGTLALPSQGRCGKCRKPLDEGSESSQHSLMGFSGVPAPPKVLTVENKDAPYMPYLPRACQMEIISDIRGALDQGRHIVIESGTGTGKTIVSLAGSLEHAKRVGKKVVYLTRTISQSDQVMKELKAISLVRDVSGVTITGRNKSCPLFRGSEEFDSLPPSVLSTMCEDRKQKSTRGQAGGCRFFDKVKAEIDSIEGHCRNAFPRSEELDKYCEGLGVCPYEAKKALMKSMDVVVAPYVHILSEDIRSNFIMNLGGEGLDIVVIVDEAHNLVDAAREQESFTVTLRTIDSALDECAAVRQKSLSESIDVESFIKHLKSTVRQLAVANIPFGKTESRLPKDAVEAPMMSRFGICREDLESAIVRMMAVGEGRMDALAERGEYGASEIYALGAALKSWIASDSDSYVRSVKTGQDGEYLSASCIDPSDIVEFMRSLDGAVHMSGTLQPLEQYYKVMGLPKNTLARTYPSPFPKENKMVVYVDDVTTKFDEMSRDPSMATRIERKIAQLCNAVDKNTLVFFPSYRVMKNMRQFLERDIGKKLYWEESGQQKATMRALDAFRMNRNGVFFSVMGGSVAEGMDFPGDELCFAIIVGIPFPPPTLESKAMSDMFDARYGPGFGWKYTSEVPAMRKIRQAVGRLIRTDTDRGMAVILDSRAAKYQRQLDAALSRDPVADAVRF
ncbi:MAG: ATP-dependent DNA helicase, partial [Candidatus Methanoplasma sp.]|nr:ATP-dependent DNA helicase [Candidatus Methanoplasma sp.]